MVGVLTEMARVCADEEVVNTAAVAIQVLMDSGIQVDVESSIGITDPDYSASSIPYSPFDSLSLND